MRYIRPITLAAAMAILAGKGEAQSVREQYENANQEYLEQLNLQVQNAEGAQRLQAPEPNAGQTLDSLRRLLERSYPPSLREVLKIDPTLLTNKEYLATYPKLAEFLGQHPEVVHNPAYFLGQWDPDSVYRLRRDVNGDWKDVVGSIAVGLFVLSILGILIWGVRAIVDYRRWLRLSKLQTEAHSRLMDRFTSNEDLLAFVQTGAGRKFLESATVPVEPRGVGAPVNRILRYLQAGLVLFFAGIGLEVIPLFSIPSELSQAFAVLGVIVMATGAGFVFSSLASYLLSRRFGLLDSAAPDPSPSTGPHPPVS